MESGRWRVLEDGPTEAGVTSGGAEPPAPGRTERGPSGLLLLTGALAIALGAVAVAVVLLGPSPSVAIESDGEARPVSDALPFEGSDGSVGATIVVDVGGAVARPGLYRFPAGIRVGDAIAAAGGFGTRVDLRRAEAELNLAARLADGDRLRVPSRDDAVGASPSGGSGGSGGGAAAPGGPIDLNRATEAELDALPGVGPATVAKIVAARAERPFATLEELVTRKVLGAALLTRIRGLVVVR